MASFFRQSKNEKFWQSYHDTHFTRDFGPKMISFKAMTVRHTKSLYNWRRNQYHQLELDQTTPVTMDENWLLLTSINDKRHYITWNCHTHQQFNVDKTYDERPVALMKDYVVGALPAVISWRNQEEKYWLRRDSECFALNSLTGTDQDLIPIDHRILARGSIYDIETDQVILGKNPPTITGYSVYNPYSNTYLIAGQRKIEVCDLNGNVVQSYKMGTLDHIDRNLQMVMANEHEVCFVQGPRNFDLRTGRMLPSVWERHRLLDTVAISPQRILYRDSQLDIVVSWHLASNSWEFASHVESVPQCLNSRFIAARHKNKTIVHDYCN